MMGGAFAVLGVTVNFGSLSWEGRLRRADRRQFSLMATFEDDGKRWYTAIPFLAEAKLSEMHLRGSWGKGSLRGRGFERPRETTT